MILRPPVDGWGDLQPRRWQAECLPVLYKHFSSGDNPTPAAIQCIMGSGKSKLAAQLLAHMAPEKNEVVVVSTSSIYLVEQLAETLRHRLEFDGILQDQRVGCYYTKSKDTTTPFIICCTPSAKELGMVLERANRRCAFLLADECHRTNCKTMYDAYESLRPQRTLGLSATCYRATNDEKLSLFKKLLYVYDVKSALSDGHVIVPWRIIPWTGDECSLDEACIEMTKFATGPGMFNAMSIQDAIDFAKLLTQKGMPAEAVHSKMPDSDVKRHLKSLEHGQLRAVVHVSMLQEGVDFPWLRWLCMRRGVSSRVRFAQEVGRVLRWWKNPVTGEEKTEAIIYDPLDTFSQLKLSYEATLSGEYEIDLPDEPKSEGEEIEDDLRQAMFEMFQHMMEVRASSGKMPVSMTPLAGYLTELVSAFDICKLVDRKIANRSWRSSEATLKQLSAMKKMRWACGRRCVPHQHQRALGMLTEYGEHMNRGVASDLLTVMYSLADKKQWPDLKHLDRAAEDGIKKTEERRNRKIQSTIPELHKQIDAPPPVQGVLFEGACDKIKKPKKKAPASLPQGQMPAPQQPEPPQVLESL